MLLLLVLVQRADRPDRRNASAKLSWSIIRQGSGENKRGLDSRQCPCFRKNTSGDALEGTFPQAHFFSGTL